VAAPPEMTYVVPSRRANDKEGGELPWHDLGQCHQSVGTSHLLQAETINDIAMSANAPINFFVKQAIPS
jgi:hypothetical protein